MPSPLLRSVASATQVRLAKSRFLEDKVVPAGVVADVVARSWERSRALGLRPRDKTLFRAMASPAEARVIAERARRLIDAVAPEVDLVASKLTQSNMIVFCTDSAGLLVHTRCHDATAPRELREPLKVGRSLAEQEFGTTAPGCVLAERVPITITGEEHFLSEVNRFVCAAAPIFQFDGSLAGVLDVTGVDVELDLDTADLVRFAAHASEHRLFKASAPGLHVRIHHDPRFVRTPLGGLLAFADDGRVLGACSTARRAFKLGTSSFLHDFLDLDLRTLQCRLKKGDVVELRGATGASLYASLEEVPAPKARISAPSIPAAPRPCEGVAQDEAVRAATERASLAFARRIPVLVTGETGTGKDVLARALHRKHHPDAPFVAINCSSIPEGLVEAELFGFADGSFTGARRGGAVGKIAAAAGGTLFLDEIGDMDLRLQARLLHFLQTHTLSRVGDTRTIEVECAVICATHRNLEAMIGTGQFREDLYHRINGLTVTLPALRDRTDFEQLVDHFLVREGGPEHHFSSEARGRLARHGWRGNVRELEQVVRTAVALADGRLEIGVEHLPSALSSPSSRPEPAESSGTLLERVTAGIARRVLAEHNGNVSAAARALGISRGTLYKKARARS